VSELDQWWDSLMMVSIFDEVQDHAFEFFCWQCLS